MYCETEEKLIPSTGVLNRSSVFTSFEEIFKDIIVLLFYKKKRIEVEIVVDLSLSLHSAQLHE